MSLFFRCIELFLFLSLPVLFLAEGSKAETIQRTGLSMHGNPKYGEDFKCFDYVNPDAQQGGELRIGIAGTFDTLNPFIVHGRPPQPPAFALQGAVYESLMARSWDEPFSLYGLIAETVEMPEDRLSIIFNLNPKAHWQDGRPITADDVLFSFRTLRDKGRPNHRSYYKKVIKAEKLGLRKVKFTFAPGQDGIADREMPLIMGLMPVLPEHDWQDREFNKTTLRLPVGSGPYRVVKADPGRTIVYKRDPNYWGNDIPSQCGMYNFSTVKIDYYRDDGIALQAFKAGEFDIRYEADPNKWAMSYKTPAVTEKNIVLEELPHQRTEATYGFIINTRHELFKDKVLRESLEYAFDFEWINRSLFHGLYKKTRSFFPNSDLAASGIPKGKEKEVLEKYRNLLPEEIFNQPIGFTDSEENPGFLRSNLLKASEKLRKVGYIFDGKKLISPAGKVVEFEILLGDPAEEKIALAWVQALKRLGIIAHVRTVDSSQYQARLASFDFDVITGRWFNSLSPGNEQMYFWGSSAADQQGSRNYPGIKDPVVDDLAMAIPTADSRDELVAITRALDRVLLNGHYIVPLYYKGKDLIAYWKTRLERPTKIPLYGPIIEAWWSKPKT